MVSFTGEQLDEDDVAQPCGLIAKYRMTDWYELYDSSGKWIEIDEKNIARKVDRD